MNKLFHKILHSIKTHKIRSLIIAIILIVIGYWIYGGLNGSKTASQYVLGVVQKGTLVQNVTGSGQVYAENQTDIKSEISGTILSIPVSVGQTVYKGQLLATIDSRDAYINLQNARISLAKLTEPAKPRDLNDASNSLTSSYTDAFNAMNEVYLDLPTIMAGIKSLLYDRGTYLSDQNSTTFSDTARAYRSIAGLSYDKANNNYTEALLSYKNITRNSSTSTIESSVRRALAIAKEVSETLKNTQNALTFISVNYPEYMPSEGTTAGTNVVSWSSEINTDISNIKKALDSIDSNTNALRKLEEGAESLDVQAEQLAVNQAEYNYNKYFIRAPFDGIVGRIPVNVHDTASSGTIIATIISNKKYTNIPLNEVDAVKVTTNQKAELSFDAIEDLTVGGIVTSVDQVGTSNQGVITYNVKIAFEQDDPRIKTGMSVDADITTEEKNNVLLVPSSAIKSQSKQNFVSIVPDSSIADRINNDKNPTGQKTINIDSSEIKPIQQKVTIGADNDTFVEIIDGLNEGDVIVIRTLTGTAITKKQTPTIFSSFGNSQRNMIRNANSTRSSNTTK